MVCFMVSGVVRDHWAACCCCKVIASMPLQSLAEFLVFSRGSSLSSGVEVEFDEEVEGSNKEFFRGGA